MDMPARKSPSYSEEIESTLTSLLVVFSTSGGIMSVPDLDPDPSGHVITDPDPES